MKSRAFSWFTSLLIAGVALGAFVAYPAGMHNAMADEDHNPRIHAAIHAIREAEEEIRGAHHDFHGEREDALKAMDRALEHLERMKDW